MTHYEFRAVVAVRPDGRRQPTDGESLRIDDLLSRGSDGLGLEVDGDGKLVLSEGADFE